MHEDRTKALLSPVDVERQAYRLRLSELVIVCSLVESGILALFAAFGTIAGWVAAAFLGVSLGFALIFWAIFKLGVNLRGQAKEIAIQQCLLIILIQFGFIFVAPKLATLFLLVLLVIFAYGLVQFSPAQYAVGWLVYGLVCGLALWLARDRFGYPGVSDVEVGLVWLFFSLMPGLFVFNWLQNRRLRAQLSASSELLRVSQAKIESLARHDALTGVLNRRALVETLESELLRARRTGHPFCFAIIDLDYFRAVNDKYGSGIGDVVLKTLSDRAMRLLRALDRFGRVGGEEFGIVLPATWLEQGMIALGRLATAVNTCDWENIASGLTITFSAGITTNAVNDTAEIMIKRAEEALAQAKREGRNRIVQAEEALPEMPAGVD